MSEFSDYLHELFSDFGPIEIRRMFGGQGVFHGGLMIGIVDNDTLYLKADDQSRQHFLDKEMSQFQYQKQGKWINLSFYQVPEEALDDASEMKPWAALAFDAALRNKK